jgi:uncharacterized protein YhfF
MMWPRVNGMRTIELGTAGAQRAALNALVLAGRKKGTAGLLSEYEREGEPLEHVGEQLVVLGDDGHAAATVQVTGLSVHPFIDVPWEFARSEGEGDDDLEQWRAGHRRYWEAQGTPVQDDTFVVCLSFVRVA